MTPLEFLIVELGTIAFVAYSSFLNANLHHLLSMLVPAIKKLKITLINVGLTDAARDIGQTRLPILEEWYRGSLWYGAVTFILSFLLMIDGFLLYVVKGVPYILVILTAMLLGSTVFFFPRTAMRRGRTIKALQSYYEMVIEVQCLATTLQNGNKKI